MPRFLLTRKAEADLKEIARYTQARWGREQRLKYLKTLDACFWALAENPHKGEDCNEIRDGYQKWPVGSHVVFYRLVAGRVEIIRILHQNMDTENRINET